MLFDEAARKKLYKKYKALSDEERMVYRVLAVAAVPVNVKNLAAILTSLFRTKWAQNKCAAILAALAKDKLVEKTRTIKLAEAWVCSSLLIELAVREALDNGEYTRFDSAVEGELKLSAEEKANSFSSLAKFIRAVRKALYSGDVQGYKKLAGAKVVKDVYERFNSSSINLFTMVFGNPIDLKMISALPPEFATPTFYSLTGEYENGETDETVLAELWAAYDEYYLKHPGAAPLMAADWAEYAALAGRVEEAAHAVEQFDSAEKYSMAAMVALVKGDSGTALSLYENGLKLLRKSEGKRKIGYLSWTGFFYPVLLIAKNAEDPSLAKKIEDYLEGEHVRQGKRVVGFVVGFLTYLFSNNQKTDKFWGFKSVFAGDGQSANDSFFYLLCAYWLDKKKASNLWHIAQKTYNRLMALKFGFLASELAAIICELWPGNAGICNKSAQPGYPLKDLIQSQSEWERSLSALSGLGTKAATSAKGVKRLAWEIDWRVLQKNNNGKTSGRIAAAIDITPVEQTLTASGWSKGKNVALKRLYKKADTIQYITDQDHRAASAIHESYDYYGTGYSIDAHHALEALAGHPYLFRSDDGGKIEVATGEPQLVAELNKGLYHLLVSPFPLEGKAPQYVVQEDGPNLLRVTRFEDRHLKMAEIIGQDGLHVPEKAKNSLLKTLGVLASFVTVHSDIEGIEANTAQAEADSRIYIQLQPSDNGLDVVSEAGGLDVEMVVRPLGPGGVSCRPGAGGQNIFGLVDSKRTQAKRLLNEEKEAFMLTVRACPALAEAEQAAAERWRLQNPELALEFLTQVQELGNSVIVEWPKGQTMRVKHKVSMSSMGVLVRKTQDWFALSGELKIGEDLVLGMKDLMELMKTGYGRFIPIGDGQFVALTKEFRRRLEAMSAAGDLRGNELRVSQLSVGLLAPLFDELGSFEGNKDWDNAISRINEASVMNPALPSTFKGELRNYQLEGYQWMSRLAHWGAGACLADDMGLGKTIQALAVLTSRGNGGPALVIAPTSVCANWASEAERFAPTLNIKELRYGDREKTLSELANFDVVVTTYGLLQNEIERLSVIRWNTIILDEAQAIKNMGTKRSAAAMKLEGSFRVATTGTPVENHLSELWNIFRFLNPNFLGSMESFNRRFAVPIERDGDKNARSRLKKIIQPFILRRSKEQVLEELPPKTEITIRVELKEEEQAFYEALRRNAVEELSVSAATDQRFKIFAELMRLRRACCNASLVMQEKDFPSAKLEAFSEIFSELRSNGHKALVFSQFVDHLAILRKYLDAEKISYQYLDGSTPPQERTRRVAAFQSGDGECFLISLKAGGVGLNLTAADYVIHMDPWWNPAVEEQASDRAHRIGQDRPVTVYRIVAKNTIEEKIVDLHAWKRDLAESLLADSEAPTRLSAEEMLSLIREAR